MAIDWRLDTEKKLWNLVRSIRQDVTARGDKAALLDNPSVTQNADGSYTILVYVPPGKAKPAEMVAAIDDKIEKATPKKKGRKKATPPPEESVADESVVKEE